MDTRTCWMVLLGMEKPPVTSAVAAIHKCEDDPATKLVNFDLYPEFYEDIRLKYVNGCRSAKYIYQCLLEEGKVPILKSQAPMKFHRAIEYINFVRVEMGISNHDGSLKKVVTKIFNDGIQSTEEILLILQAKGISAKRSYVNDIKSRFIRKEMANGFGQQHLF